MQTYDGVTLGLVGSTLYVASEKIYIFGIYDQTTASASNININSNDQLRRVTSSRKYKTNIEPMEYEYIKKILDLNPVFYRSLCPDDDPTKSYFGLIAEEVALIEPRNVFFRLEDVIFSEDENKNLKKVTIPLEKPIAEGVAYDRFVPHLIGLAKRQQAQIDDLISRIAVLEGTE